MKKNTRRKKESSFLRNWCSVLLRLNIELLKKHVEDWILNLMKMRIVILIFIGQIQEYSLKKFRSYNLIKELITFLECKLFHINIILAEI